MESYTTIILQMFVHRLQPEIGGMFADEMDIMTLTQWRRTCKTNYYQAVGSLKRSLTKMLDHFVPSPDLFLRRINDTRSIVGGEFALAFILRDMAMLPKQLDVYASDHEYNAMCASLLEDPDITRMTSQYTCTQNAVLDALRTQISSTLVIETTKGTCIRIHRSYTPSSTAPISRAPCTALSNFITAHGFGCSHPLLTLNRRALIGDQDLPQLPVMDRDVQDRLIKHGFSLAFSPIAWPEFRRPVVANVLVDSSSDVHTILDAPRPTTPEDDMPGRSSARAKSIDNSQIPYVVSPIASCGMDGDRTTHETLHTDHSSDIAIAAPHGRDDIESSQPLDAVPPDNLSCTLDISSSTTVAPVGHARDVYNDKTAQSSCGSDSGDGYTGGDHLPSNSAALGAPSNTDIPSAHTRADTETGLCAQDSANLYTPQFIGAYNPLLLQPDHMDQPVLHGTLRVTSPFSNGTHHQTSLTYGGDPVAADARIAGTPETTALNSSRQDDELSTHGSLPSTRPHSSDGIADCARPSVEGGLSACAGATSGASNTSSTFSPRDDGDTSAAVSHTPESIAATTNDDPSDDLHTYSIADSESSS